MRVAENKALLLEHSGDDALSLREMERIVSKARQPTEPELAQIEQPSSFHGKGEDAIEGEFKEVATIIPVKALSFNDELQLAPDDEMAPLTSVYLEYSGESVAEKSTGGSLPHRQLRNKIVGKCWNGKG